MISPMLAAAGALPEEHGWAYEMKWDGVRALATCAAGQLRLHARSGAEVTVAYPELADMAAAVPDDTVLDGEIVCFDSAGRPSFAALADRMHVRDRERAAQLAATTPVTYMVFDVLRWRGRDVTGQQYDERRLLLDEELATPADGARLVVPPRFTDGPATLAAAEEHGLEGVVAKRRASTYRPGQRSTDWVKVKRDQTGDFVVGGWRPGRRRLGALLVGSPTDSGALAYRGRVGGGIGAADEQSLLAALEPLHTDASPFDAPLAREEARDAVWVRPETVVEVRFTEQTRDGRLRFPRFVRRRPDKPAAQADRGAEPAEGGEAAAAVLGAAVVADGDDGPGTGTTVRVDDRRLEISNLGKVLFPETGTTKSEVIDYYARVAPVMLPYLRRRPLTRIRYPDGVTAGAFFEKNAPAGTPRWVHTETLPVPGSSTGRETIDFIVADDLPTLVWLANLAALELHTPQWQVGPDGPAPPDLLVVDLDPGPPAGLADCARVALRLRDRLSADGLAAWPKTSGKKGMQLYCPLAAEQDADTVSGYVRRVATELAHDDPQRVTAQMARRQRPGKVFIDWSQNAAAKTTVAPYSLRAQPTPTVAAPLWWDEVADGRLGRLTAAQFTPAQVLARVERHGDLLAGLLAGGPRVPEEP